MSFARSLPDNPGQGSADAAQPPVITFLKSDLGSDAQWIDKLQSAVTSAEGSDKED